MALKLVSFVTCPYVQRAVLVLRYKGIAHETAYVDLANKPDWLLAVSPRGKVPVLLADGAPLFESQAICEYLEETHPTPALFTDNPIERARDRAWFNFASEDLFWPLYQMQLHTTANEYQATVDTVEARLRRLQTELGSRTWLSGSGARFGMAEVAMAPAFTRIAIYEREGKYRWPGGLEPLRAWAGRVLDVAAVRESVPPNFEADLLASMRKAGAYLLT